MTQPADLGTAADTLRELLAGLTDDQLAAPTPCPAYRLGDLVEHVNGFTGAFSRVAVHDPLLPPDVAPSGDAGRLPGNWREELPLQLTELARRWRDPQAWTGSARAAGIELPNAVWGLVARNELVVHAWDIAVSSGRPYHPDPADVAFSLGFLAQDADNRPPGGPFGPVVPVDADTSPVDRMAALAGRDPRRWQG